MELAEGEVVFEPALDFKLPHSFLELIEDVLTDIRKQATLIDRIKPNGGPNYLVRSKLYRYSLFL